MTSRLKYLTFGFITCLVALAFIIIPRNIATIAFVFFVVYPLLTAIIFVLFSNVSGLVLTTLRNVRQYLTEIPLIKRDDLNFNKNHLREVILLFFVVILVTRHHFDFHPEVRVDGHEIEWLTGYGQIAHQGLQETGTIPRWHPYYRQGEPLVDSAFSYIFNPFSSIPHLLIGSTHGSKISIVVNGALACLGGWFLAWVLGLSRVGRLMLALMILSKGNMHANFDGGYYQLALQQVYFPWVIAGILAVLRTNQRWAIILTALSMALMFLAGNIWHILPMGISMVVLILLHFAYREYRTRQVLIRLLWVGVIAFGLGAVLVLSTLANFHLIDKHPDLKQAGWEVLEPNRTYLLPFIGDYHFASDDLPHVDPSNSNRMAKPHLHFYYSYVSPWWFVLLIILPIPLLWKRHPRITDNRLLWFAGLSLYVFFTMWGMGGTPLFIWLYDHVPFLPQWRFVSRALGMSSFWIAILVALRIDTLVQTLFLNWRQKQTTKYIVSPSIFLILCAFYVLMSIIAIWDVSNRWRGDATEHMEPAFTKCMNWFAQATPDEYNLLWVHGYNRVTDMLKNDIRLYNIEADYLPGTAPNTIGNIQIDARNRYTEYRSVQSLDHIIFMLSDGYFPVTTSPSYHRIENCLYRNEDYALPYAFIFNIDELPPEPSIQGNKYDITSNYLIDLPHEPIETVVRNYDVIGVKVRSSQQHQRILVIQELAYPGWEIWVDGERYQNDIFARLNAVTLPMSGEIHEVIFIYRPPLLNIGGIITIITAILSSLYLLKADRLFKRIS